MSQAVSRAVLLAAGRGERLGPLTAAAPKPLVELNGRPAIAYILDGLAAAGIADVFVVTGYQAEAVERAVGDGSAWGLRTVFARQLRLEGTARALGLARDWLGDRRFAVAWADVLMKPANHSAVLASNGEAVIAVNAMADVSAGAAVSVTPDWRVTSLIEKPPPGTARTPWNNAGFSLLGSSVWTFLDALEPSERGEYELPRAIGAMVAAGLDVRAVPVVGPWFDIGTPETLAAARQSILTW